MSDLAIRVEHLGKRYRLGRAGAPYRTLRETITGAVLHPLRTLRQRVGGPGAQKPPVFWALRDVSFEVRSGEVMGIVGRNGAGKSTLLKVLSRITEPSEGYAELRGRVGTLLEVGTGFHPELTGRENILLNGAILGMRRSEIERKFDEIVAFAEIERFIDTQVKHYSSGMYLRLAFAVAAHLEPEILVVDEVLAVGDAQFQKKCLGKMEDVARQGRTVLFVSHNMAAVRNLCTRAIMLKNGQIDLIGPTETVIAHYLAASAEEMSSLVELPPGDADVAGVGTRLRFSALDGSPKSEFMMGEPWRIRLEFELRRPVEQMIAAVGLLTFDSFPVITYWSRPKDLSPGRYYIDIDCDIPLASCDLQFAVGLSSHQRSFYYVPAIGHVSVSEIALGEQPVRASGSGLLLNTREFEIQMAEPQPAE